MSQTARKSARPAVNARIAELVGNYRPLPGVPDEFIGDDGQPKAHWRRLIDTVAALPAEEMKRRFSNADRHLRDAGVSYRVYGEAGNDTLAGERAWPLSHVPLVIAPQEWRDIAAGVVQRATLSERILSDVYGKGDLVEHGLIPAAAISGSPDYLRPVQGVSPRGSFIRLYAADLGRGPDGRWWVLGDRTQAPSGAGYALENRLALSRSFPDLYRELDVERLAPFFQNFRAGLVAMAERSEPRICLLTPGALNETYFEQAYLARYLGFLLVEGADLIMRNGQLLVRTIAGLKRADVLWRRIDADFADPLELNSASRLGVPGLVEAVRDGRLAMANALGSGLLEARALMGFLPTLCRHLLDEELLLPSIATWWCGQPNAREEVLANLDRLAVASAFRNGPHDNPVLPAGLAEDARAALARDIQTRGLDYVGQEVVKLSTMPVYEDGRLEPRPFTLRVYAAMTPDGWQVMPGGFCRVSDRSDVRAISMREGVRSADVWVLADGPVAQTSLLPPSDAVPIKRILGNLPSRAADNMFWLGRYLERVEATLRLVRALMSRLLDADTAMNENAATLTRLAQMLAAWGSVPEETKPNASADFAMQALHGNEAYGSALCLVQEARRTAGVIRERLSPDAWRILSDLQHRLESPDTQPFTEAEALERCELALRAIAAFSGLAQENMNRVAGWRFLQIGRRLERGIATCRFARVFADKTAPVGDLEVLLDLADSQITYRSRYLVGAALAPVRDLVLLDPFNPRSVAFQVDHLDEHIASLPALRQDGMMEAPRRLSLDVATRLRTMEASGIDRPFILATEQKLMALSDAVAARYFLQGPQGGRAERLTGLA